MSAGRAIRSDFLIHWTGKDLDDQLDPKRSGVRGNSEIAKAYLGRLESILTYGLWLTEEAPGKISVGDTEVDIPSAARVCFTELKLSESNFHAREYGRLGIGFKRPYLFNRGGRPVAYNGFRADTKNDPLLEACARDLEDKTLLNFFKPMNKPEGSLDYAFYSESEWRVLFSEKLLKKKLIIDPRDPANVREFEFFQTLSEDGRNKLRYLMPLDGWLSFLIYPSFHVKNMVHQCVSSRVTSEIERIKRLPNDHANKVEKGNWPVEIDLPACLHL